MGLTAPRAPPGADARFRAGEGRWCPAGAGLLSGQRSRELGAPCIRPNQRGQMHGESHSETIVRSIDVLDKTPATPPDLHWLDAGGGYALALDGGRVVARGARGTVLRSLPAALRRSPVA